MVNSCSSTQTQCRTFHAGGCDDIVLSYSFLCTEAGPLMGSLIGLYLQYIDDIDMNLVGSWTRMDVSYA